MSTSVLLPVDRSVGKAVDRLVVPVGWSVTSPAPIGALVLSKVYFFLVRMIDVEKPDVKNVIYSIAHNAVLGKHPNLSF